MRQKVAVNPHTGLSMESSLKLLYMHRVTVLLSAGFKQLGGTVGCHSSLRVCNQDILVVMATWNQNFFLHFP